MSDDFNYSKATAVRTIFAEGVHAKGQLYEEVQVCRCNGKRYYVVNCMTDPMNAGGSSGLIPSWCISDAQILRYVAQKHSCLEYIDDTKNKKSMSGSKT